MKKRGNSWGGEALGVAKPVSPPHTPPLRARRCATPWRVLIYRLSPVCCCLGGVRLSRFFVPPDGKAARAAGLFPGIWQIGGVWRTFTIHLSAQSLHNQHRRIQNYFQYIVTYHNAEQRRARKGGARGGKAGFVTPSAFPPRKPAHCQSVSLKGNRPLPKCLPEREPPTAQVPP